MHRLNRRSTALCWGLKSSRIEVDFEPHPDPPQRSASVKPPFHGVMLGLKILTYEVDFNPSPTLPRGEGVNVFISGTCGPRAPA